MNQPSMNRPPADAEQERLAEARRGEKAWKRWGPYLSERAWGTVREDYSPDGSSWDFFPHDHARSRAYRWGEDGLGGICDQQQTFCMALGLWNTHDPILKERLFGLTGPQGNHGEDVKEVYYYLDATPTHSYLKFLYKYPIAAYPYGLLLDEGAGRSAFDGEYEIKDTGVFDRSRYFDVYVEYAKADAETILMRVTAVNRSDESAELHVIPQLWYRNDWSWDGKQPQRPVIWVEGQGSNERNAMVELGTEHEAIGRRWVYADGAPEPLLTENDSNAARLWNAAENPTPFSKDAFHEAIVHGRSDVVNPQRRGSKAGLHYQFQIQPQQSQQVRLIFTDREQASPFEAFDDTFAARIAEADAFYEQVHHRRLSDDERKVQRQAAAGMLWSNQFYMLDMATWLEGDKADTPPPERLTGRNHDWNTIAIGDVISMPDKWEYPWFAAWDWAFHAIPLAMLDVDFAKSQLELMLSEKLQHPNGQIPAYEWAFSDVNPPVQAWAVWRVYNMEKHGRGEQGDMQFLERCYHKLLLNFTWWVNRKDSAGRNVFQGGFLGLDNISVFDRSQPLPGGGHLEQADATGWMGLFSLNMMAIGLELAQKDQVYEHLAIKFFEHFMHISAAINGETQEALPLWDEQDGWYYDMVHGLDGRDEPTPLAVRSQVGLIPLFAANVLKHSWFEHLPAFKARYEWLMVNRPQLTSGIACVWTPDGAQCIMSIVNFSRLKRILARMLDETEFLSPYGIRALSRHHLDHPYTLAVGDRAWQVQYEPAESTVSLFGGNSNWRGPIWMPTNFMLITVLRVYDRFFGDQFKIECPTGSGQMMTLNEVAIELATRLCRLFLPDGEGGLPIYRRHRLAADDPSFAENPLFYEYFDGDCGAGLGASHQTGWTGLVMKMLDQVAQGRADEGDGSNPPLF